MPSSIRLAKHLTTLMRRGGYKLKDKSSLPKLRSLIKDGRIGYDPTDGRFESRSSKPSRESDGSHTWLGLNDGEILSSHFCKRKES